MERRPRAGSPSGGTCTSTTVPSLIATFSRGRKTPFSYFAGIVMTLACVAVFAATLDVFVLIVAFGRLSPGETGQDAFFARQETGRAGIRELCSPSPKFIPRTLG